MTERTEPSRLTADQMLYKTTIMLTNTEILGSMLVEAYQQQALITFLGNLAKVYPHATQEIFATIQEVRSKNKKGHRFSTEDFRQMALFLVNELSEQVLISSVILH